MADFETEEEFDARPPPPLSRTWGYWVPRARHDAEKAELARLRAENERLRGNVEIRDSQIATAVMTIARLRGKIRGFRALLRTFILLDWDEIIASAGGTPMPPGIWRDWDEFMSFVFAALGDECSA